MLKKLQQRLYVLRECFDTQPNLTMVPAQSISSDEISDLYNYDYSSNDYKFHKGGLLQAFAHLGDLRKAKWLLQYVPQDSSEWMAALECAVELNNGDFVSEMLAELQMTLESFAPQRQCLLKHALLYLSDDVVDTLLQMTEPQHQLAMDWQAYSSRLFPELRVHCVMCLPRAETFEPRGISCDILGRAA
jgi:hypothetical protein